MARKQWKDLSAGQRGKPVWALVSFVNFVGSIAYFLFGRRRPGT